VAEGSLVLHAERQELKRLQEQPGNSELHHMDGV
jgi:hypothetical protein